MKKALAIMVLLAVLSLFLVSCQTTAQTQTPGYGQAVYAQQRASTCCVYPNGIKVGPDQTDVQYCYQQGGVILACGAPAIR